MVIHLLDNSLINKIAAGEVIERPASVVKELLENSFDAGSDMVKIEIEDAGLSKIKISDNGGGMDKEDLLLSYKRHATSKINNAEDLFDIHSLGFRGEALASIAEISNLIIKTKKENSATGHLVEVESGQIKKQEKTSCPDGTIIEVRNLFFNVPARKKYLKSNEYEFNKILKILSKYALIRKDVSITLIHNGKEILNSQKTPSMLNNIISVYGVDTGRDLFEVNYKDEYLTVQGFISKPSLTRSSKDDQSIYVNNRYIKNKTVEEAVYSSLHTYLFTGRHPIFILDIKIDPKEIDVNVHPSKELIRLKDEKKVFEIIENSVRQSIEKVNLITNILPQKTPSQAKTKKYEFSYDKQENLFPDSSPSNESNAVNESTNQIISTTSKVILDEPQNDPEIELDNPEPPNPLSQFNVLGQINKTFIVCESPEGLAIIDQHAAEERVNYEKFMNDFNSLEVKKQTLIEPKIIELTQLQKEAAKQNQDFLSKLGYDFSDFGDNTIKLSTIPVRFANLRSVLLIDIISELVSLKSKLLDSAIEEKIIRMSCRASIKAGDELTFSEIKTLISNLSKCKNPYSCPHGRPTIINFSIHDLEKKFKRTGW